MAKIPDRFLGFAFSVGDILIETDKEFNIINADGALSSIGLNSNDKTSGTFLDLMDAKDRAEFLTLSLPLKDTGRVGPANFRVGADENRKKRFSLFVGKLPDERNRIFIVLVAATRLNQSTVCQLASDVEVEAEEVMDKIETLLIDKKDEETGWNITLMETRDVENASEESLDSLNNLLKKYASKGEAAGRLSENRFALVHDKEPNGIGTEEILEQLSKSTGIELNSTTIDADHDNLNEEDGIRTLLYSLQQFADEDDGFDIESLAESLDEMVVDTEERKEMLRKVLENEEFSLVYKPTMLLANNQVQYTEALIRFNDPDLHDKEIGSLQLSDKAGMILDFDKAIFNQAVKKIEQLKTKTTPSCLAVNLSGKSLSHMDFIEEILKQLEKHSKLVDYISIDITEASEINDLQQLTDFTEKVRAIGYRVFLNGLSAGSAGYKQLSNLKINGVKIDGHYIRNALNDRSIHTFLRSIISLSNKLGIDTIANDVETEEQQDMLVALGVTYAQGKLYGKPKSDG